MSANAIGQALYFDVYAQRFIPHSVIAVNSRPAHIIPSLPVLWIDFAAYVSSFAGTSLLLADPPPPVLVTSGSAPSTRRNTPSHNGTASPVPDRPEGLRASGYHTYFQSALIAEVAALELECRNHDLYGAKLAKAYQDPRPDMYWLQVPGLREFSLRIDIGDIVQLRPLTLDARGEVTNVPHQYRHDAVVWSIDRRRESLTLCVSCLAFTPNMLFNVCFTVQAGRLGALHRSAMEAQKALQSGGNDSWTRSMLFPDQTDGALQRTLNKRSVALALHDPLLNYEQVRAVDTVLTNDIGKVPYLISGPPGTGKTKTLVELALQLVSKHQSAHLLLCAPSDSAADTLVQRLSTSSPSVQLFRLTAPSRSFPEVPDNVLRFCCVQDNMFSLPPFQQMMSYKIVVTTCRDAELMLRARLSNADLHSLEQGMWSMLHPDEPMLESPLHWTALLMDEAAQAVEPEALIPLSVIAPPTGYKATEQSLPTFVMAGDQSQLGPRTASRTIAMQTSLFERLLNRPLYFSHPLARSKESGGVMRPLTQSMLPVIRPPFTNLIRNYRSHPAILATPSVLFYNDTLEPEARDTTSLLSWFGWKGPRNWPVLFCSNTAPDETGPDGSSLYNTEEAKTACWYALSFLNAGLVQQQEICIMSPFRAQVYNLRQVARQPRYNIPWVNIGPLEAFQGLESKLVILCTTRTRRQFVERDNQRGLGVIHEPRRFNVALTRAKEGLIVIGNPVTLQQDRCWETFLAFCCRNGLCDDFVQGYGGQPLISTLREEAKVVSRLEKQLIYQAEHSQANGVQNATNGMRRLGFGRDEDEDAWRAGVAAEEAVQQEDGVHDDS